MSPPTSLKYTMPTNGMRWHAGAKTILPSRAQDGKVMEAFERLRIAKRAERQNELVNIVDQAIDMAIALAGYRRAFGSLPDGWFEKGDDGKPVVGCNEYLFVFAEKVAEQTRLGRALRRSTGVNTTFVDLFLAVVYGRLRYIQHRKDNGLQRERSRDHCVLAQAVDEFLYEARKFGWCNDELAIYMNEVDYVEDE